jgi:hypothetical protein
VSLRVATDYTPNRRVEVRSNTTYRQHDVH